MVKTKLVPILLLLFTLSLPPPDAAGQDSLEDFEEEVKSSKSSGDDGDDNGSEFWEAFFEFLYMLDSTGGGQGLHSTGAALKGIFTGAWPTDWANHNPQFWTASYSPYPYQSPKVGLFVSENGKRQAFHISGHYLHGGRNLENYNVSSLFSPSPFYSIEARVSGFTETRSGKVDRLALYGLFLNYNRIRSKTTVFRFGLGMKSMQRQDVYYGPAVNASLEVYPGRPLSFAATANVGSLNSRAVWETLLRLNAHIYRGIAYVGYQRFTVGSVKLDGPVLGLGIHF